LSLERYEDSAHEFTTFLKRGGAPNADIFRGRGKARMELGDYSGAVDDYTTALWLQTVDDGTGPSVIRRDDEWEIWNHRGWAYFFAGAHRLALKDFETSIGLNAPRVDPLVGRGLARVELGQVLEAVEDANAALKQFCDDPAMLLNIACILGRAASRNDTNPQHTHLAVATLRQALGLLPAPMRMEFWGKVLKDDCLRVIRVSAEFQELEKLLERDFPGTVR